MKPKNLIILAAVVALFGAYLFFFERHQLTSDEARQEAEKVLPGLEVDDVSALVIESDQGRVRLEKPGDEWRLVDPIAYPADSATVGSTLSSLGNLAADRRLPAAEVSEAEYGLDMPEATVTLSLPGGAETTIEVGDEMPLGSKRPVRVSGSDEILVVPGWFLGDLLREVEDWRDREVTDLRSDRVASIEIEAGDDVIRALRLEDQWQLVSPVEDAADADHLEGLVSDLGSLRIEEFLDDVTDPAELGLDAPEYSVLVVRADGGEPLRLDLGATREGDGGTEVACRRGDDDYFWSVERVRTRLSKAPVLWRASKVVQFDAWDVEGLRLETPANSAELEKVDYRWRFTGDQMEARQSAVTDRLTALSELEATDYDLMDPITAEMGRAELALRGTDEGESATLTVTFFEPLSEGGKAMVRVSGRTTVMGVDASAVESILAGFDALRPEGEIAEEAGLE